MAPVLAALQLAHPLTERGELPVSPLFLAAVALVVHTGGAWAARRTVRSDEAPHGPAAVMTRPTGAPDAAAPRAAFVVTRLVGLGLLALAITAGRFGHEAQLSNITPALVIGAGWPLVVIGAVVVGHVWWWLDPFDTAARAVAPLGAGEGGDDTAVWWAVPLAALWVGYLTLWPGNLAPRTIATALIAYTVLTLAGCLAVGRRAWLTRAEIFGIFFAMVARTRNERGRVALPDGAHVLLGVLAGGFLYGLLRDSQLLAPIGYGPRATLYSAVALTITVLAVTAPAHALARRERHLGAGGVVAVALVVAAATLAVALAMARNRLTTSVQLLPILASDPFGSGRDLFGTRSGTIDAEPLGAGGLIAAQIAVLVVGHLLALLVARRRVVATESPAPARVFGLAAAIVGALVVVSVAAAAATLL